MPAARFMLATPANPGAIAVIQLSGDVERVLAALTGRGGWPPGRLRLVSFDGIDEGLAVRLGPSTAQLMPHGGPRVVQRIMARLVELDAAPERDRPFGARELYPEAEDEVEALALAALARASSPLVIDALLDQPRRWRHDAGPLTADDLARSRSLDRLVTPPLVVAAGPPNVGKSTLANRLLGRPMSIELDHPGTTRDYTVARMELAGLVVDWHDTPGLRRADDAIEHEAIEVASRLLDRADFILALTDAAHDWADLPRAADLRVATKSDLGRRPGADLAISALTGAGLAELVRSIRDRLVPPADLDHPGRWLFDERLAGQVGRKTGI